MFQVTLNFEIGMVVGKYFYFVKSFYMGMIGNFSCLLPSANIFKIKKFFWEHNCSVKQFKTRSGPTFGGPDLGLNCLQWLSADYNNRQRERFNCRLSNTCWNSNFSPSSLCTRVMTKLYCMLGNFSCLSSANFFKINFQKILSEIPSECQTV